MRILCLSFLLLSLSLPGCEGTDLPSTPGPEAASATSAAFASINATLSVAPHPSESIPIPADQLREKNQAGLDARIEMNRLVATGHWRNADAAVRSALAEPPESVVTQHLREQIAAGLMLQAHLLPGNPGSERREALAHYTRLLVKGDSPEAGLILQALEALEGHIPEAERSALAAQSAAAATTYAARGLNCEGCSYERLLARMPPAAEGQMRHKAATILDAIGPLQEIASTRS